MYVTTMAPVEGMTDVPLGANHPSLWLLRGNQWPSVKQLELVLFILAKGGSIHVN